MRSFLSVRACGPVLCTNFPFIVKQRADQVDLKRRYQHHHKEIDRGPKVHPVEVALLEVSIPSLEGAQQSLDLYAFAQTSLHIVDGVLTQKRRNGSNMTELKAKTFLSINETALIKMKRDSGVATLETTLLIRCIPSSVLKKPSSTAGTHISCL